jgi:glucose-1-phosphate cytidylyltransferase
VSNVNISQLIEFHKKQNSLATVTAVQPPGRFGALNMTENKITGFEEKPQGDHSWINGGFFILSSKVIDFIEDDSTVWEREPMEKLAQEGQLSAFIHKGFWHPMDTLRDKTYLETLWETNTAPWKVWQ